MFLLAFIATKFITNGANYFSVLFAGRAVDIFWQMILG